MVYDGTVSEPTYLERNAPASSYAIADVIEGTPGAWPRVAGLTAWRAVIMSPGLWVAGIRGRNLVFGSVLGATAITVYLLGYYGLARSRAQRRASPT
jgi:hypothetical protein